jgi:hypothetical protein
MNAVLQKLLFVPIFLFVLFPCRSFCQDLTGIWKGYFITDGGESYRLEFQIEQNRTRTVTGVSYSYGDNIKFYGKATMTGRYTKETKSFLIQEIKTVEVKSAGGGTCIMNYRFSYSKSGSEEYLEGSYLGKSEDRTNPKNNGVWGDCGGGRVFLRRVKKSDFYVEPFLRNKQATNKEDSVAKKPAAKPPAKTPVKPDRRPSVTTRKPVAKPSVTNKPAGKDKTDTVRRKVQDIIVSEKPVEKPRINIPVTTRSRKNELVQTLNVTSEEIKVRLYDNGEVDDDTISVYMDGKPLVTSQRLSTVPISLTVKMDPDNPEHTLVMVAENMGRIPPNTSLMIVQDGDKRYQVSITSTEQKNAMVRFRYQKKSD